MRCGGRFDSAVPNISKRLGRQKIRLEARGWGGRGTIEGLGNVGQYLLDDALGPGDGRCIEESAGLESTDNRDWNVFELIWARIIQQGEDYAIRKGAWSQWGLGDMLVNAERDISSFSDDSSARGWRSKLEVGGVRLESSLSGGSCTGLDLLSGKM